MKKETVLILHNIRSVYNVGSIFRTADGAGVPQIYLTGVSPTPRDRFGRWRKDFSKVSLGAEKVINWKKSKDIIELMKTLKKNDFVVVSVEQHKNSVSLENFKPKNKTAYILGNETEGLPEDVLKYSDSIVEIIMKGNKESLNVSVVAGVVLFNK